MAASSSFFSFLLPPKPKPPQFTVSPSLIRFPSQKHQNLVSDDLHPSSSSSSSSSSAVSAASSELSSVICPSLANANTLFFRSAYNVQVVVAENENEERLLNRFRREVMKAGVIQESKRRRYFENKQDEKKRKTREAAKRNKRSRYKGSADKMYGYNGMVQFKFPHHVLHLPDGFDSCKVMDLLYEIKRTEWKPPMQNKQEVPTTKKEVDDDNWDMPEDA